MIRVVLTDIEGTTSSLSFVKDVLFPYARRHIDRYVREHASEAQVTALLNEARREMGNPGAGLDAVIAQLADWIDHDRKVTPLKALQGLIWEAGYAAGDFSGHIYADAAAALRDWHGRGVRLYVYSSGSVHAQKLLFAHTEYGDLTPLFSGYFDTRVGHKAETASYRHIASQIEEAPEAILFLSDIVAELDAAREAGMQTCQLVREGDLDPESAHRQARDFAHLSLKIQN
ncbi:MAG: acireductone synthase [Gammaproteobacteria bacterium]|nr:acireductone synthase [Gammaproteobacteria bacterium]